MELPKMFGGMFKKEVPGEQDENKEFTPLEEISLSDIYKGKIDNKTLDHYIGSFLSKDATKESKEYALADYKRDPEGFLRRIEEKKQHKKKEEIKQEEERIKMGESLPCDIREVIEKYKLRINSWPSREPDSKVGIRDQNLEEIETQNVKNLVSIFEPLKGPSGFRIEIESLINDSEAKQEKMEMIFQRDDKTEEFKIFKNTFVLPEFKPMADYIKECFAEKEYNTGSKLHELVKFTKGDFVR